MAQKYDLVWIKDLSNSSMSHFHHSCRGIVVSSYNEKYGNKDNAFKKDNDEYTVFIEGHGEVSWYDDWCFENIEHNRKDLLDTWMKLEEDIVERESNTYWIFNHLDSLKEGLSSTSICTLAKDMGISEDQMWGNNGEWFVFDRNAQAIMSYAQPYLVKKDLNGWKSFCEAFKEENSKTGGKRD